MIRTGDSIDGRYEVVELLGEGGIAQVWLVRHNELGSFHALKMLVWRNKPKLVERLLLEGRIQAQLRHPNVVSVTDVLRYDGQAGLLMEFIDGENLQSYLAEHGALGVDRGLELFAQILAGVAAAHDASVLHRDLKPANILLAATASGPMPKITDFGLAKLIVEEGRADGTRFGAVMGTPGYMAPEQARDSANVTAQADIFALGAILCELVNGRGPFPPDADLEDARTYDRAPDIAAMFPGCPPVVAGAITRALDPDPAGRFEDCRAFAKAIFANRLDLMALIGEQRSATMAMPRTRPTTPSSPSIAATPGPTQAFSKPTQSSPTLQATFVHEPNTQPFPKPSAPAPTVPPAPEKFWGDDGEDEDEEAVPAALAAPGNPAPATVQAATTAQVAVAWRGDDEAKALVTLSRMFPGGSPHRAIGDHFARLLTATDATRDRLDAERAQARRRLNEEADRLELPVMPEARHRELVEKLYNYAHSNPRLDWIEEKAGSLLNAAREAQPLRVAVFGVFSAGKSSLLNALLGAEVLPTGVVPVTAFLTEIRWGEQKTAEVVYRSGQRQTIPLAQLPSLADAQVDEATAREVDQVIIRYPAPILQGIVIYDTPGFNSGHEMHEMQAERVIALADVVLWVFNATRPGSEIERAEIRHVQRSAGKAVGLLNQIDAIRPSFEKKPERWQDELDGAMHDVSTRVGEGISAWIPVSAPWMREGHAKSGRDTLLDILHGFRGDAPALQEAARTQRLQEGARIALTLARLQREERLARQEHAKSRHDRLVALLAEIHEEWNEECKVATRTRQFQKKLPELTGPRWEATLVSILPELGAAAAAENLSDERLALWNTWIALEGHAKVLTCGGPPAQTWERLLDRAAQLDVETAAAYDVWLPASAESTRRALDVLARWGDVRPLPNERQRTDDSSPSRCFVTPLFTAPKAPEEVAPKLPLTGKLLVAQARWQRSSGQEHDRAEYAELERILARNDLSDHRKWGCVLAFLREKPIPDQGSRAQAGNRHEPGLRPKWATGESPGAVGPLGRISLNLRRITSSHEPTPGDAGDAQAQAVAAYVAFAKGQLSEIAALHDHIAPTSAPVVSGPPPEPSALAVPFPYLVGAGVVLLLIVAFLALAV